MKVYLLPGIATDHHLFDRLDLGGLDVVKLDWPRFRRGTTLEEIAKDMAQQVDRDEPHILVGVSMGGMVAQELALITNPAKVILISTWTGPQEWPRFVRFGAAIGVQRVITATAMKAGWPVKRFLTGQDGRTAQVLRDMALREGPEQIRRGLTAIFRWRGSRWKGPIVRIHGDKDRLMPIQQIKPDHVVRGGAHAMVYCHANAVSAALRAALT